MTWFLIVVVGVSMSLTPAYAQPSDCVAQRAQSVRAALTTCAGLLPGQVCSADEGRAPLAPQEVLRAAQGDMILAHVPLAATDASAPPPFLAVYVVGEAELVRDSADDLPPWGAFTVAATGQFCAGGGHPAGVLLQSPLGNPTLIQVDGVRLTLTGTAFLARDEIGLAMTIIEGGAEVVGGPRLAPGARWTSGTGAAVPYDAATVRTLPLESLPRVPRIPLPGAATVIEPSPLYAAPDDDSAELAFEIPAESVLSIFGADLTGTWRHVRTPDGLEGWVPQGALSGNPVGTLPAYNATPQPLTRPPGPVYARGGTGFGAVRLRMAPGDNAGVLTELPANLSLLIYGRSPDAAWVYVELEAPIEGYTAGWASVPVIDLPEGLRLAELPIWPVE